MRKELCEILYKLLSKVDLQVKYDKVCKYLGFTQAKLGMSGERITVAEGTLATSPSTIDLT